MGNFFGESCDKQQESPLSLWITYFFGTNDLTHVHTYTHLVLS